MVLLRGLVFVDEGIARLWLDRCYFWRYEDRIALGMVHLAMKEAENAREIPGNPDCLNDPM